MIFVFFSILWKWDVRDACSSFKRGIVVGWALRLEREGGSREGDVAGHASLTPENNVSLLCL